MVKSSKWGNDAWVEHISNKEMPALSSTVRILENLANDDTVSLAKVGQSVLHDYALTSSILKVANSAAYMGRNQVTTVSRAAVVLGYTTIRNICITAKLLTSLLKNKNFSEAVYERLLKQMAQSFHAGMLTQMMMKDYDDNTKEETFIAALLHHVGESAFWSSGGNITKELDEKLQNIDPLDKAAVNKVVAKQLGTTFDKISVGLATTWNLGDNFIRSLDNPDQRTPEMQIVDFADRLSACIANPAHSVEHFTELLKDICAQTGYKEKDLRAKIEHCTGKTEELLKSYDAGLLVQYLHPDAEIFPDSPDNNVMPKLSDEALQLQILRELTFLTMEKGDFNVVVQTAVEGIFRGIGMDRVVVMLKNTSKKTIEPRFISAANSQQLKEQFTLNLNTMENVFTYALKNSESVWVNDFDDDKWAKLVSKPIRNITCEDGFFLAPIMWDKHCIGLIYADRSNRKHNKRPKLGQNDFMSFTHFTQQTNLCLSMILKRTG